MHPKRLAVLLIVFLWTSGNALSQQVNAGPATQRSNDETARISEGGNYLFRHLRQENGLIHNDVLSITQDQKGFIWVATPNGLQRYDGSRFTTYPEMLNNPVEGLTYSAELYAVGRQQAIWISNNSAIEKMDVNTHRFTLYDQERLLHDRQFGYSAYTAPDKTKFLLDGNILFQLDSVTGKPRLRVFNFLPANSPRGAQIISDSSTGLTWAITGSSRILVFDTRHHTVSSREQNRIRHPLLDSASFTGPPAWIRFVMIDSEKNIWISTWGDPLYKYDARQNKVIRYSLRALSPNANGKNPDSLIPLINCMMEDDHHSIWFGTENRGVIRFDPASNQFENLVAAEAPSRGLDYNFKVFSLYQDREQNIWVGTDKGISVFSPYRQYFTVIRHSEENPNSLMRGEIQVVKQAADNRLYIGTWGGGMSIYEQDGRFIRNRVFTGEAQENFIWSITEQDDGHLWLGCQQGYLLDYDPRTDRYSSSRPGEFGNSTVRVMTRDRNGNTWFGLHNGTIVKWDRVLRRFIPSPLERTVGGVAAVISMHIDRQGRFWVSAANGFKEFDPVTMRYKQEWSPGGPPGAGPSGKFCQGIEQYDDSTLLIGTVYGGLSRLNTRTLKFNNLTTRDGLPANSVYAIRNGEQGFVWLTTDYGLYQFHPLTHRLIPYAFEPGMLTSAFIGTGFQQLQNRKWITFSMIETISFDPARLACKEVLPPTEITGVHVFDNEVQVDSLLYAGAPLELGYTDNFITIDFAAPAFAPLHQQRFEYRLDGVDQQWVNGKDARVASYTDLKPGIYTFRVRSIDGTGSGEISALTIIIRPPFWQTWWFLSLVLFTLIALSYAFVRWRIGNIRTIEEEKRKSQESRIQVSNMNEQLSKAKLEALRSQMNPHFIFNCINSIDSLIQSDDKYHATVYLNKFAKLIRNVLDSSKQDEVLLSKDLETLRLYIELEQLRHENKFRAEIRADEALLMDDFRVPPLIVQPFVENAILHGLRYRPDNLGELLVSVQQDGEMLRFIIEDNGVGRKAVQNPTQKQNMSYGIEMSNDRVRLFNRAETTSVEITDLYQDGAPAGTRVQVLLNIH